MGYMDQFAAALVAPYLQPGEQILWMGCLLHPTRFNLAGVPDQYSRWMGVGTDRRLVVIEAIAEHSLSLVVTNARLKPEAGSTLHEWWYDELGEVWSGAVEGLTNGRSFYLDPFTDGGPLLGRGRRYDVFGGFVGFDAHMDQGVPFMAWLAQGVARRAFPVHPAKQSALPARIHQWEALRRERGPAAVREIEERRRARRGAAFKVLWLAAFAAMLALAWEGKRVLEIYQPGLDELQVALTHHQAAIEGMTRGERPPTSCPLTEGYRSLCVCVADPATRQWFTNDLVRRRDPTTGLWCNDLAILRATVPSLGRSIEEQREHVRECWLELLGGATGACALVVLPIVLGVRRRRSAAALTTRGMTELPPMATVPRSTSPGWATAPSASGPRV